MTRLASLLARVVLALTASGCVQAERQAESTTHQLRKVDAQGTIAGQPFVVTGVEDVTTDHKATESRQYGIDPQLLQLIDKGAQAAFPWSGPIAAGAGSIATAALAAWASARKSAQQHQADATEGWAKYEDAMKAKKDGSNG